MFDVGFWEVLVLFGIALMVLGPERLPQVAKRAGTWVGRPCESWISCPFTPAP